MKTKKAIKGSRVSRKKTGKKPGISPLAPRPGGSALDATNGRGMKLGQPAVGKRRKAYGWGHFNSPKNRKGGK